MSPTREAMSDSGRERLMAALPRLRGVVVRRGRRARLWRAGVALASGAGAVAIAIGAWWLDSGGRDPGRRASAWPQPPVFEHVETLGTDQGIESRVAISGPTITEQIGDDELRAALAAAGKPEGLVRVGAKVRLSGEPWSGEPDGR